MPDKNPSEESEIVSASKSGMGNDALSDKSRESDGLGEAISLFVIKITTVLHGMLQSGLTMIQAVLDALLQQ